jgi:hypothetical protein
MSTVQEAAMNTQIRFTTVEARENLLHMQALQEQSAQDALAQPAGETAPHRLPIRAAARVIHATAHGLWLAGDELALELADLFHGHRPHRHHHAH